MSMNAEYTASMSPRESKRGVLTRRIQLISFLTLNLSSQVALPLCSRIAFRCRERIGRSGCAIKSPIGLPMTSSRWHRSISAPAMLTSRIPILRSMVK